MAFPFVFEANFETGDTSEWDSAEAGSATSALDVAHYTDLARFPWPRAAPFRGAYCLRATLTGGTDAVYVQEGDIDVSAGTNNFFRFSVWFSPDFTATADDVFDILDLQATAGPTSQAVIGCQVTASTGAIVFGAGVSAPVSFGTTEIERGKWYVVEVDMTQDSGANDGAIAVYVTREGDEHATVAEVSLTGQNQSGATEQGRLGVQNHLATTTGTVLLDAFAQDDARLYPDLPRYDVNRVLTKSGHVFVGAGCVRALQLILSSNGNEVITLYDTDNADTNHVGHAIMEVRAGEVENVDRLAHFEHGCFALMSGTNPIGQLFAVQYSDEPGVRGPYGLNDALVRRHGLRRKRGNPV